MLLHARHLNSNKLNSYMGKNIIFIVLRNIKKYNLW